MSTRSKSRRLNIASMREAFSAPEFLGLSAFLAVCIIVGGNSNASLMANAAANVSAIALLAFAIDRGALRVLKDLPMWQKALIAGAFVLPMLQLIPLPSAVWAELPGRESETALRDYLGFGSNWYPLSLDPRATAGDFFYLIIPLAAFCATSLLGMKELRGIQIVICVLVLVSITVAVLQVASRGTAGVIYDHAPAGVALGFFPNRNHFALLVAIGFALAFQRSLRLQPKQMRLGIQLGLSAVAIAAVLASASRAGLLLCLGCIVVSFAYQAWRNESLNLKALAAAGIAGVAGIVALIYYNPVARDAADRFQTLSGDARFDIWTDSLSLAQAHLPLGSGFGTYVPLFKKGEELSDLSPYFVNHAHNEYLEVALEGGIPALLLIAIFVVLIFAAILRRFFDADGSRVFFALLSIVLLVLHSLVDYPLRTPALAAVFGVLLAMAWRPQSDAESLQGGS